MYIRSPSPAPPSGTTPAPTETGSTARSSRHSSAPHSLRTAYPHLRPLQYARHVGSSTSAVRRLSPPACMYTSRGDTYDVDRSQRHVYKAYVESMVRTYGITCVVCRRFLALEGDADEAGGHLPDERAGGVRGQLHHERRRRARVGLQSQVHAAPAPAEDG
uniref:Uncharacterized protein n=1 Tax=Triticum urartu TaxID=4572 RepID=A0A8R7VHA8_TRIUA